MMPAGTLVGFAKVTHDLTNQLQAEVDRRERLASEDMARLRAEFLTIAAHELKTPLTSLRGMADLTLRRFSREFEVPRERVGHALRVISNQSGKISRLVERLLDFSRLETGQLMLERRETDLRTLMTSVADMFSAREDGERVHLTLPDHPISLPVDALRMEQVVTNLIDNALKYSPHDLPVHVSLTGQETAATTQRRQRHQCWQAQPRHQSQSGPVPSASPWRTREPVSHSKIAHTSLTASSVRVPPTTLPAWASASTSPARSSSYTAAPSTPNSPQKAAPA